MLRVSTGLAAAIVAGAALLGNAGQAAAQSTTTTSTATTTTTSTTLLPHPFSAATRVCLRSAKRDFHTCGGGGTATCRTVYETAYSKCFASGPGVTCAKRCITRETSCFTAVPTTKKTCRRSCFSARRADVKACKRFPNGDTLWAASDAACFTTADATYDLCKFVCSGANIDCRTALTFCVANCANL